MALAVGRDRSDISDGEWSGRQVGGTEALTDGAQDQMIEAVPVAKSDLGLGRVHVDVHLVRRKIEEKGGDGIAARHEQAAVSLLNRMAEAAIANAAAVDEQVLQ